MSVTKQQIQTFLTFKNQLDQAVKQYYIDKYHFVPDSVNITDYDVTDCTVEFGFDFKSPGVCSGTNYEHETISYDELTIL